MHFGFGSSSPLESDSVLAFAFCRRVIQGKNRCRLVPKLLDGFVEVGTFRLLNKPEPHLLFCSSY